MPLLLVTSEARVETYGLSVQLRVQLDPQRMNGCVLWFYISILWDIHLHNTRNHSRPLLRVGRHAEGVSAWQDFGKQIVWDLEIQAKEAKVRPFACQGTNLECAGSVEGMAFWEGPVPLWGEGKQRMLKEVLQMMMIKQRDRHSFEAHC